MKIYEDCGYFNEEKYDEYSPYPEECEACYRYDICIKAKELENNKIENIRDANWASLVYFFS